MGKYTDRRGIVKTKEEAIAMKISDSLADVRLDPERIGFHLGHTPEL